MKRPSNRGQNAMNMAHVCTKERLGEVRPSKIVPTYKEIIHRQVKHVPIAPMSSNQLHQTNEWSKSRIMSSRKMMSPPHV